MADLLDLLPLPEVVEKMGSGIQFITPSNAHELNDVDFAYCRTTKYWHKFIVENGGLFDKEDVLQSVLYSLHPFSLVPVKFTVEGKDAFFIARNCGPAIQKFCSNSLSPIEIKNDHEKMITLSIHLFYKPVEEFQINLQDCLKKAISKKLKSCPQGCINLTAFHKEPELYEILYYPLYVTRFLVKILNLLNNMNMEKVNTIILSHNDLENVIPLENLKPFKFVLKLDLSFNKIKDVKFFEPIGKAMPKLQEVNLEGNPLYDCFETNFEYSRQIQKLIPSLSKLDDLTLYHGIPSLQNWFCSQKAVGVINEFLKHYFVLYDRNRRALEHTYDNDAIFSMTCNRLGFENFKASQLECYQICSKQLVKLRKKNEITGPCYHNNTKIARVLCTLPPTKHDPYSFKVDVLLFQESSIILVVFGVFKDFQDEPRCRSFNRTFILKKLEKNEYKITNDLYHVGNATEDQILDSCSHLEADMETKEEEALIEQVAKVTEMNRDYSKKCLQDCGWNLPKALMVFLNHYHCSKIPEEAFIK